MFCGMQYIDTVFCLFVRNMGDTFLEHRINIAVLVQVVVGYFKGRLIFQHLFKRLRKTIKILR